jgi:hypothetical protein
MLAFLLLKKSSSFLLLFRFVFAIFFRSKSNSVFHLTDHSLLSCILNLFVVYYFKIEIVIYILFIFLLQHLFSTDCINRRPGFY